ncbi:MAG: HlyD family efflux transporter periplasmic adaptor subunit [Candidatus Marinimicrobia bacterium]|jgi:HlyD family secretion protein|nr:HlyD family efflux transporter periplasmic adaptor subunit [Candidatus Neomarinimicrobiota bacterium]MBT4362703.1 HlyD family efflux transporter periplasmic adaptor subunit [Candidatus Neomarinimicrobiota bacterium]MBT4713288.1 HlyD family efflux transporter periplasmic adaptor subunit [Candidatus Neomarinimicrobiota bacterium]MBT4944808.1 HlyD family efflux transporter periplasmic adaptor subunit [Candidatus Neomarinimicrobiota bacterium]MBT5271645.1 HlyD family efflux transporter periplasm
MDRDLSKSEVNKRQSKVLFKYVLIGLLLVAVLLLLRWIITPKLDADRIVVSMAEKGRIEDALSATGIVIPEFEQVITSPIQSRIEAIYFEAGAQVSKGSQIVLMNKESITLRLESQKEQLELLENRKLQLDLQLQKNRNELQARYDIYTLKIDLNESKLNLRERLHKIGAETKDMLDQARLNLKIAKRERELLGSQMENDERRLQADLKEVDLQVAIQRKAILELERQLERSEIRADRDGVITWVKDDIGATVLPGAVVARVADLRTYKVEARISDIHVTRLKIGGPIKVRANDHDLPGNISSIIPTVENGVVSFLIDLEDNADINLRSNLRVDVFVITSFKDDVIRAENGPYINGSGPQNIFIMKDNVAHRKRVVVGATNLDHVEFISGVSAGDRLIITDMEDYIHLDQIEID